MTAVRMPAAKPNAEEAPARTDEVRTDYRARPVKGDVDVAAIHRDLARRYPVIRAHLAK